MSAHGRLQRLPHRRMMALVVVVATVAIHLLSVASPGFSSTELAEVRASTARFHRTSVAQAAGWDLVTGLDHCFDNPGVGAMGYHYINLSILGDTEVDPKNPEALVYAPGPNGKLQLAAVEWIVPDALWTGVDPPTVMGHDMHLNSTLGVWVLHAWIFNHNPSGMFEDWNPRVTCP